MSKISTVLAAILAIALFAAGTAVACPNGYVACGETQQLCCPGR